MFPISLPYFCSMLPRRPSSSAMECSSASLKRCTSWATSFSSICRLGTARSSASSTTAVLMTTPGETAIPFLISIRDLRFLSLFAKLFVDQLCQLLDGCFGIFAVGDDLERRAFDGRQGHHLHHAFAIHLAAFFAKAD